MIGKAIESILIKIAWKMEVFTPASAPHIGLLILTLVLAAAVFFLVRKIKCSKTRLLFAEGILLVIMECIKQFFLTWVREGDYSWSDFPFQLCSIPMYLMLLYPFLKIRGKRNVENYLMTFGMIGGMAALIEPVSIFTDYVVLTLHSILWHMMLVITSVFLLADRKRQQEEIRKKAEANQGPFAGEEAPKSGKIDRNREKAETREICRKNDRREEKTQGGKLHREESEQAGITKHLSNIPRKFRKCIHDYQGAGVLYLCFAAAAIVINACLRTISHGTANMFFLGPSWPDMFILNDIYSKFGWLTESILFAAATCLAGLIVYLLYSI